MSIKCWTSCQEAGHYQACLLALETPSRFSRAIHSRHFGQLVPARARETAVPERTLRRKVVRFAARGMQSLVDC
jgi:hypothetical protein